MLEHGGAQSLGGSTQEPDPLLDGGQVAHRPLEALVGLERAREAIAKTGNCAVVNVWVDPNEYAPGTKAQTMYK